MGKMAMGGIGQVLDSVEFVKRAWGGLNLPSTLVPTVDIDELDKRIADLKAVEQWLNMNLSMLHGTIQGLEIQRGTIAAVKAFGASFGNLAAQTAAAQTAAAPAAAPPRAAARAPAPEPEPEPELEPEPPEAPAAKAARSPSAGKAASPSPEAPPAMLAGINPTAWWNLLQQNFNQVAQSALTGGGLQDAAATAIKAAGGIAGAAMPRSTTPASPAPAPASAKAARGKAAKPASAPAPAARKPAAKPRRTATRRAPKAGS
jgi:hypothetical protein